MRKRAALGFLVGWTPAIAGSIATAQNSDPYASDERQAKLALMTEEMQHYKASIRQLYFALGCKVFQNKEQFAYLSDEYFEKLNHEYVDNGMFSSRTFHEMLDAKRASAEEGLLRSKASPTACKAWHDHPDAVLEIRRLARDARPSF